MPVFSDERMNALFESKDEEKKSNAFIDRISDNEKKIKDAKDKAIKNFKKNTSKKKKIKFNEDGDIVSIDDEYLEEKKLYSIEMNGKRYRILTPKESNKINDSKNDIISFDGKKYICDNLSQTDQDPEQKIGKWTGLIGGAAVGGQSVGGLPAMVIGGTAGSKLGRDLEYNHKIKKYTEGVEYDYDIESLEELFINDKKYRPATEKDFKDKGVSLKDAIIINGKKYIYDDEAQKKYNKKHPVEYVGKKIGSTVGGAAGAAVGGAAGAVSGAAVGGVVGGITGGVIGSTKAGHAVGKGIRSVSNIPSNIKKKITREDFDFRNVYRSKEFTMAMEQYFDTEDDTTRKVLLAVNEDDQNKVLIGLTSKLYENIIDKVDDIDFGEIPMTKGDITKLSNYNTLMECIDTMTKVLIEFKQDTKPIDTIRTAISNIISSVNIWKRAYAGNIELPMVVYNTTVLAIIEATTYMISMCIDYIKSPSDDSFQITIDKSALTKTKNHLVFENLDKFNEAYRKGQITNAMEYVIKENVKNFAGTIGVGASIVGIVGLLFCIIPIIRELIFLFYYQRVRVSEFFDTQADMLQMNAYNVEHNRLDLDKEKKKSISSKQSKIADKFRKFSNKIGFEMKDSEAKATKELTKQSKKMQIDDVVDELPDSASSALF